MIDMSRIVGLDWDDGNRGKNARHGVDDREVEEVFLNEPLHLSRDYVHSVSEPRYRALGRTDTGRRLTVFFTFRADATLVRAISARPMSRKERATYEEAS